MENQKPIPTTQELKNSSPLKTFTNQDVWIKGYILRQTQNNGLIPISVFFDPADGKILTNTLPSEIREEYEGKTMDTSSPWESNNSYQRTEVDPKNQFLQSSQLGDYDSSQEGQDNQQPQWGQDNQQQTPSTNWEWK